MADNWDLLDDILGIPSGGADWPITKGIDAGIYGLITSLTNTVQTLAGGVAGTAALMPIGAVIAWFRADESIDIPDGFNVCDGTVLTAGNHDFAVGGSVTMPDLRNRFILGADASKSIGTAGAAVGSGSIDDSSGAPGPQGTGGSNQNTLTTSTIPSHAHTATTATSGNHTHSINDPMHAHGAHKEYASNTSILYDQSGQKFGTSGAVINFLPWIDESPTGISLYAAGSHTHTITVSNTGGGSPHENRPRWMGLIYICKVKNV